MAVGRKRARPARIALSPTPNASPVAIAARALAMLWAPATPSVTESGRARPRTPTRTKEKASPRRSTCKARTSARSENPKERTCPRTRAARSLKNASTVRASHLLKRAEGLLHLDQERLPRFLSSGMGPRRRPSRTHEPAPHDCPDGALLQRVGHELVTVKAGSGQRHEQIAAPNRSRIRPEPSDRRIRQGLSQNPVGDRGYFVGREQGHGVIRLLIRTLRGLQQQTHRARASMASRATTRSSKRGFSCPLIWQPACPFPAISTRSQGRASL